MALDVFQRLLAADPAKRMPDPEHDGKRIAFASRVQRGLTSWGSTGLWTVRADGAKLERVPHSAFAADPAWGPR